MRSLVFALLAATTVSALSVHGTTEIAPDVHLIPGSFAPPAQPDGNTVIFTAPDGLIVMDTGRHAAHTQQIIDYAKRVNKPVKAIINSHWHLDHIGGNALLRREFPGVRVYASGALNEALTGFLANYRKQLVEMIEKTKDPAMKEMFQTEVALIDSGSQLAPDVVIDRSSKQTIAGRKLAVNLEKRAVTAGDVWVFDPKTGVLAAGDLVTLPGPFLDTACPKRWSDALGHLSKVNFKVLIPGHGAPMSRGEFEAWRFAYDNLLRCAESRESKDECVNGWLSDARTLIPASDDKVKRPLMEYYVDLLRGDTLCKE